MRIQLKSKLDGSLQTFENARSFYRTDEITSIESENGTPTYYHTNEWEVINAQDRQVHEVRVEIRIGDEIIYKDSVYRSTCSQLEAEGEVSAILLDYMEAFE